MHWYSKLLATVFAAMCCLFVIRQASASAPNGGYRVVETRSDVVIIEIGNGATYATVAASFGEQFHKATGYDLKTFEGLEALQALNPDTTIPVCWPVGDGPVYKQGPKNLADKLVVWSACPKADKTLWLIAGLTIKIPLVSMKIETYSARMARYEAFDACEDASCIAKLVKNEKAIAGLTHAMKTDAPPAKTDDALAEATAKIAKLEKSLAEAKSAPATIVPSGNTSSSTHLHLIYGVLLTMLGIIGYAGFIKPRNDANAILRNSNAALHQTNEGLNADLGNVTAQANAKTRTEFMRLATAYGIPDAEARQMTNAQIVTETIKRREATIRGYELVIDGNKRDYAARDAEVRRLTGLRAEDAVKLKAAEETQRQLNQARSKLEDIARDKQAYGELEDKLAPSQEIRIAIDDERTTLTAEYARADRGLKSEKTDPKRRDELTFIAKTLGARLMQLNEQRDAVLNNVTSLQQQYDALHERLTGRKNLTTKLYTEAQHDRNDAAADRAAAQNERAEATLLMEAALAREADAKALREDTLSFKADLDARQQAIEDVERPMKRLENINTQLGKDLDRVRIENHRLELALAEQEGKALGYHCRELELAAESKVLRSLNDDLREKIMVIENPAMSSEDSGIRQTAYSHEESGYILESTPESTAMTELPPSTSPQASDGDESPLGLEKTGDYAAVVILPEQHERPTLAYDRRKRRSEQYINDSEFAYLLDILESYEKRHQGQWTYLTEDNFWRVTRVLQNCRTEIDPRVFLDVPKDVLATPRASQVIDQSSLGIVLTTVAYLKLKPPTVGKTMPPAFQVPGG